MTDALETGLTDTFEQIGEDISNRPVPGYFQSRNTDTTTNINSPGLALIPIVGDIDETSPDFTPFGDGARVIVNVAALIEVSWNISYTSNDPRISVETSCTHNLDALNPRGRGGYVRDVGGHNRATSQGSRLVTVAAGDNIGIASQADANAGNAFLLSTDMDGGDANMIIKILERL